MPKPLRWTDRSIRTKLLAAFAVLIAGSFAAGIVTWMQNQTIGRLSEQTLLTQDTINAANRLLVAKINQEAGMRGYVLTADEAFLDPFTTGKAGYDTALAELKRLVGEDEDQQNRLMLIDLNARSWGLELAERQLSLMRNPSTREQARRLEAMGIGKKYMDGIRAGVGDLIAAEEETLGRHREEQRVAIVTARLSMLAGVAGSVVLAILLCKVLTVAVSRPIVRMTRSMTRLAEGDHGVTIEGLGRRDEIGAMAEAVAVFKRQAEEADRLSREQAAARLEKERRAAAVDALVEGFEASVVQVLDTMATAAREFDATAQEMAAIAEQTKREALTSSSAAEQTASNVQAVAAAAEQMAGTLNAISGQVSQSNAVADQAVQEARETDETVRGLAEAAQRIGEVVGLINSIASQTNLLALNATIEAARAGEAGRGFAVVANEVKSLANQTARATDQIGEQIAAMQQVTTGAVAAIRNIGRTIGTISEIATGIAGSVEEETVATREIARNVQQAAGSTREVSGTIRAVTDAAGRTGTAAGRVLTAAGDLSGQVESLHGQIGRFLARIRAA